MKFHSHHGKDNNWTIVSAFGGYKVYDMHGSMRAKFSYYSHAVQYVKDEERRREERGW